MVLIVIALVLLCIEVIYFKVAVAIISKFQDGLIFIKVWCDGRKTSGWIKRSLYYSCVNGKKADYDLILLENKGKTEGVVYGSIRQIKEVRGIIAILLGSR